MAAHQYWRVSVTSQWASSIIRCGTLEMATTPAGPDVCSGGVAAGSPYDGAHAPSMAFDGDINTYYQSQETPPAQFPFLQYDFGAGNEQEIVEIRWANSQNNFQSDMPKTGDLLYSDDNLNWNWYGGFSLTGSNPWPNSENTTVTLTLVTDPAEGLNVPQAGLFVVERQSAEAVNSPQLQIMAPYNVPAKNITSTYADYHIGYRRVAQQMPVTQGTTLVVYKGKVDNPKLKSWAYTLDSHDNFVLKLGTDNKTLVFDISTGTWSWWASPDDSRWRASTGMNWYSSGQIPFEYGSNVIVGDDSYGVLWVLDPEKATDDDLIEENVEHPFERVATGQMPTRARQFEPIYSVYLTADLGSPKGTNSTVTLDYSDDQGHSYVTADAPQVANLGDYAQEFAWRSMGRTKAPGRLFRITDYGAFSRIDGMDVNA